MKDYSKAWTKIKEIQGESSLLRILLTLLQAKISKRIHKLFFKCPCDIDKENLSNNQEKLQVAIIPSILMTLTFDPAVPL